MFFVGVSAGLVSADAEAALTNSAAPIKKITKDKGGTIIHYESKPSTLGTALSSSAAVTHTKALGRWAPPIDHLCVSHQSGRSERRTGGWGRGVGKRVVAKRGQKVRH